MTIAAQSDPKRDDPLYGQGMAHLQDGNWQEAIRCFEALARQYPGDPAVQRALDEARFRARLDSTATVRPRRSFIRWRSLLVRLAILAAVVVIVYLVVQLVSQQLLPTIRNAQAEQALQMLLTNAEDYLQAEEFDKAEDNINTFLEQRADDERALALLDQVQEGRQLLALYEEGAGCYSIGDHECALDKLSQVVILSPEYRDARLLIQRIKDETGQDDLFAAAVQDFEDGNCAEAVPKLERLQTWNVSYRASQVEEYLTTCYIVLARDLIYQEPADVAALPQARSYLQKALALRPTNAEANGELTRLRQFLDGKQRYEEGYAESAITPLRAVFNAQPDYQDGLVRAMLYEAYWRSGDQYRNAGDCGLAYERYRQACEDLDVANSVLACERQESVAACLTPTATPTPTPTATPTPRPTSTPGPTATPTPPAPLATFRNQIVFRSDNPEQPGYWVMNPDGSNRRYLGRSGRGRDLDEEFQALREAETWDPAQRCRTYTTQTGDDDFPQVYVQCKADPGGVQDVLPTWKVSKGLNKVSYDPVWAPDGSRIAFVSQTHGSDDIWVSDPLGESLWNYTENDWEWDKHPSFSPDSQKIVFWSNREGTKQIFVIDANGRNLKKIFATTWDEYDPLWIK